MSVDNKADNGGTQTDCPQLGGSKLDSMPSNAELNALQAQIDKAANAASSREGKDIEEIAPELSEAEKQSLRIKSLKTELVTAKDQAIRAMAETQNIQKRCEREIRTSSIYAVERFATDMLSVSDNLSRALSTIDEKARGALGDNAKNLLEGLELTEKDLIAVFSRHGIKPVPGQGSKFDPNIHQAVARIPSDETKGDVAQVMQNGFTLGDRTLRAAMVAVSTGPQKFS